MESSFRRTKIRIISGVLDGLVVPEDEDSEDYPSMQTMLRWLRWLQMNLVNIEGYLRRAGMEIFGLEEELLTSRASLLGAIRERHSNWLEITQRIICNSGGWLSSIPW